MQFVPAVLAEKILLGDIEVYYIDLYYFEFQEEEFSGDKKNFQLYASKDI